MTLPIDPIRRAANLRRARRASDPERTEETHEAEASNLPVPVDAPRTVPPATPAGPGAAIFAAQMLGQEGQKRGLRAGPRHIDTAKDSYNRTEWSGSKDRRGPKGGRAKTEV